MKLGNSPLLIDAIAGQAWYNCFIVIDFHIRSVFSETAVLTRFHSSERA
jgi:hypothetical protein